MWWWIAVIWCYSGLVVALWAVFHKDPDKQAIEDFCYGMPTLYPARERATKVIAMLLLTGLIVWVLRLAL